MLKKIAITLMLITIVVSTCANATIIYDFRTSASPTVLGTIEFTDPPATATAAWTSTNPTDLLSLFLDDTLFALGAGNVLDIFTDFLVYDVASIDGTSLDFSFGIQDSTPGGAAGGVSDFFQLGFSTTPGQDVVESFANANFVVGDWTVRQTGSTGQVPEPVTLVLFCLGLTGLSFSRYRKS